MNKKIKFDWKKAGAIALGAFVIGGTAGALAFPVHKVETKIVAADPIIINDTKIVEKEVPVEVIKEIEVEKLVEVDNGDMDFVLERLEDKAIIDDASEIVAELKAEDFAIAQAFNFVDDNRDDLFDMLEDKGIISDEDDVKIIKVYDDFEDVSIVQSDFDDEEYEFILRYKVYDEEDEVKKYINVTIEIEDGDIELSDVVEE